MVAQAPEPPTAARGGPAPGRPGLRCAVAVALVLAAAATGLLLVLQTWDGWYAVQHELPADGDHHAVRVEPGQPTYLWVQEYAAASCSIIDRASGDEVLPAPNDDHHVRSAPQGTWTNDRHFDSGSGDLDVTCAAGRGAVQLGPSDRALRLTLGVLATVGVPLLLTALGVLLLRRALVPDPVRRAVRDHRATS